MLAYLRLQLLHKWRGYQPQSYRREGRSKARAALGYFGFALLALYLYGMVVWMEMLLFTQFERVGQAWVVLPVAFLAGSMITLVYGFFSLIGNLFFAKDTSFVAALPVSAHGVLAVKALMTALGEAGLAILLCAPPILRVGLLVGAGADFYAKALLACAFLPLIPLAIALPLSFALIRVSALWKRREGATTIACFVFVIGMMLLSMGAQSVNEEELGRIIMTLLLGQGSLTERLLRHYPPLGWVNDALLHGGLTGFGELALFMAVSAAVFLLMIWLLGKRYLALASRQEEALRSANRSRRRRGERDRAHTPTLALFKWEVREVLTIPAYATNCLMGVVMFPMMMLIAVVGMRQEMGALDLASFLGGLIPRDAYLAGAAALMCVTGGMNMAVSTAVSREGKRHELYKTYPVAGSAYLLAKLGMGMLFGAVTEASAGIVLWVVLPAFWGETLLAFFIGLLFSLLWCCAALVLDTYRPKLTWKTEMEAVKQNLNGLFSMLLNLAMVAALGGVVWLGSKLGASLTQGVVAAVALILLGAALMLRWLTHKASATYFLR